MTFTQHWNEPYFTAIKAEIKKHIISVLLNDNNESDNEVN